MVENKERNRKDSFNIEDFENVRLVRGLFLASMDCNDLVALFAEAHFFSGLNNQLDEVISALE